MISPNTKPLEKPYGLHRVEFLRQFSAWASERLILWTGLYFASFYTILGTKATEIFKPAAWAAMEDLRLNQEAIANGLLQNPPIVIAPIPHDDNLPHPPPAHQAMPINANVLARWKLNSQSASDFELAKRELKTFMKDILPKEIFDTLVIQGGSDGWAAILPEDVFELILSDEYGQVTPSELKSAQAKVSVMWKKELTLKANLENMKEANILIGATFPHLLLSEQDMFRIAYDIGISSNFSLVSTINNFMDLPGQGYTSSHFTQFMAYLLLHYPKMAQPDGKSHLAFFGDAHHVVKPLHKLGLAAIGITKEEEEEDHLALAALNKPDWNQKNWDSYQKLLKKPPPKGPPKPPPVIPAGSKLGKICFNCGWNDDHNSRRCPVMINAPPNSFTPAQMALVRFSPSKHPHSIDGKPINQKCAPGVHGWP